MTSPKSPDEPLDTLTRDEKVFAARMLPYMLQGMTFDEAAQAVVKRDQEIYNTVMSDKRIYNAVADSMVEGIYQSQRMKASQEAS